MNATRRPSFCLAFVVAVFGLAGFSSRAVEPKAGVKLTTVKYDAMIKEVAASKAKLTVVDVWATWCGPCKEHFPDFIALSKKYGDKGVAFASVSLDDAAKPKAVAEATAFLQGQQATITNYLLDESMDDAFEKFDISAISAVFLLGPDGKVVRRFTQDDPNHIFTYPEIDTAIQEFLAGKPMTTGDAPKPR